MPDLVVDTDVLSFGFRQEPIFVDRYGPAIEGSRAIVSFMTVAELAYGMLQRGWGERRQAELLRYVQTHYIRFDANEALCHVWGEVAWDAKRKGRVIQTADTWIAATAKYLQLPLVTHNARDFEFLSGIQLITFSPQ